MNVTAPKNLKLKIGPHNLFVSVSKYSRCQFNGKSTAMARHSTETFQVIIIRGPILVVCGSRAVHREAPNG